MVSADPNFCWESLHHIHQWEPICIGKPPMEVGRRCTNCWSTTMNPESVEKVVQTTEERVREAAKSCPQAREVLEKLFPGVIQPVFKAGDIVSDPILKGRRFVVAGPNINDALDDKYSAPGKAYTRVISLTDGESYCRLTTNLVKE